MQRSKSVYNIKPALAVGSGRLRKQEAPCGDPYSSSLFALLFLPTELREWGRDLAIKVDVLGYFFSWGIPYSKST